MIIKNYEFQTTFSNSGTLWAVNSIVHAQNTSTVYSPDVTKGKHAVEYRAAFDADNDSFAHRLHYQYCFTDSLRGRIILLQSGSSFSDLDYRYVRLETMWQFLEDENAGWDSALRLELQIADSDDPPSRVRLGWTSKVDISDRWQLRGVLKTGRQFGKESRDGFLIDLRAQASYKITDALRLAVDYYGDLNDTDDIGSFAEQEHQLGPMLKFNLGGGWKGIAGALFGLSEAAADSEFRLIMTSPDQSQTS